MLTEINYRCQHICKKGKNKGKRCSIVISYNIEEIHVYDEVLFYRLEDLSIYNLRIIFNKILWVDIDIIMGHLEQQNLFEYEDMVNNNQKTSYAVLYRMICATTAHNNALKFIHERL